MTLTDDNWGLWQVLRSCRLFFWFSVLQSPALSSLLGCEISLRTDLGRIVVGVGLHSSRSLASMSRWRLNLYFFRENFLINIAFNGLGERFRRVVHERFAVVALSLQLGNYLLQIRLSVPHEHF